MTTLAYKDGLLAADSACTSASGVYLGTVRKLTRAPDGSILAAAGKTLTCTALARWAEDGMEGKPDLADEDFNALVVRLDGTVHLLGGDGTMAEIDAPFHAEGSGYEIALGAMAAGATAEQAVRIACQFDGKSREPVHVMRLQDPTE